MTVRREELSVEPSCSYSAPAGDSCYFSVPVGESCYYSVPAGKSCSYSDPAMESCSYSVLAWDEVDAAATLLDVVGPVEPVLLETGDWLMWEGMVDVISPISGSTEPRVRG